MNGNLVTSPLRSVMVVAGAVCAAGLAMGQTIPLDTLTLNGSAHLTAGKGIVLTTVSSQAGSAFIPTPYTLGPESSFEVAFAYNAFSENQPADGLAFVAQNTPSGASYLGTGGSGLGFFTLIPGTQAIGATFDYYSNALTGTPPNTISIAFADGTDIKSVQPQLAVYGGGGAAGRRYVWVDYSNSQKAFLVYYSGTSVKPAVPTVATILTQDLSSKFGGQVYFGFTGGTGALSSEQGLLYLHVATF